MDPYIGIFIHNNTKLLFIIWLEKFTFSKPKKKPKTFTYFTNFRNKQKKSTQNELELKKKTKTTSKDVFLGYILRKLIKSYILLILLKIITLNHSHIVNPYRIWAPSYANNSYATFLLIKIKMINIIHIHINIIHIHMYTYVWY